MADGDGDYYRPCLRLFSRRCEEERGSGHIIGVARRALHDGSFAVPVARIVGCRKRAHV